MVSRAWTLITPILTKSTLRSIEFIRVNEILRCQAEGTYCKLIIKGGKAHMASKIIKEFEYLFSHHGFLRVHQSHLVNISEIKKFIKSDTVVVMNDETHIGVSKSRKESFLSYRSKPIIYNAFIQPTIVAIVPVDEYKNALPTR